MKLNITPGPWYFSKGEFNGEQHNETALGSIMAKTEWNWVIAEVQSSCWENQIEEDKESYDNAAAIVTAVNNTYHKGINPEAVPEMLEAIECALSDITWLLRRVKEKDGNGSYQADTTIDKLIAVLQKATL